MRKIIFMALMLSIALLFVSAVSAEVYTKKITNTTVSFTCFDGTNNVCDGGYCNATVRNPTGVSIGFGSATENNGYYDYTIHSTNLTLDGRYKVLGYCQRGNITVTEEIEVIVNQSGDREDGMGYMSKIIVWLVTYLLVYFVFIRFSPTPLYNFVGYMFIVINSILGIIYIEGTFSYITLGASLVLIVDKLYKFLQDFLEYEEG